MTSCVLVSGAGDYADPWHRFGETSARLAGVLEPVAGPVEVREEVERALAEQDGSTGLLVVNLGNAGPGTPTEGARAGLHRHLATGRPLLVVHVSATAFPDWPEWEAIVGGRWVEGTTFHPEQGRFEVRIDRGSFLAESLADFETDDEAYTALRVGTGVTVLAHHDLDGESHPLAWLHRAGPAPVAYVALGHDDRAYDTEGTRELLRRCAARLLEDAGGGSG